MGLVPFQLCKGVFFSLGVLTVPAVVVFRGVISASKDRLCIPMVGSNHRHRTRHDVTMPDGNVSVYRISSLRQ